MNVKYQMHADQERYVQTWLEENNVRVRQVTKATLIQLVVMMRTNVLGRHVAEELYVRI